MTENLVWIASKDFPNRPGYMAGGFADTALFWAIADGALVLYDESADKYATRPATAAELSSWEKELREYTQP